MTRLKELEQEIRVIQSRLEYYTTMIGLLLADQKLADTQIEKMTRAALLAKIELRDLQAELKDTI